MVGLKGSRVIVVDDEERDGLAILRTLAGRGIPAAFFNGSPNEVPAEDHRLLGVRLAILDMDLVGAGADDKSKISTLVNVLGRILHPNNGPYGAVAWTKHKELVAQFDARVFSTEGLPKPIFVLPIEKAECWREGSFDLTAIAAKLRSALEQFSPLLFLQAWEERCYLAATAVTNTLSEVAGPTALQPDGWRIEWRIQLLQLIHAIAEAAAGGPLADGDAALSALYAGLNPLHSDRMESTTADLSDLPSGRSAEIVAPEASKDCGTARKAKVNTMLHLALEQLGSFRSGNIYPFQDVSAVADAMLSPEGLIGDCVQKKEDPTELAKVCTAVLVEINPPCDHVQKNIRTARLLGGFLVPVGHLKRIISQAQFLRRFGPLFIKPESLS